MNWLNQFGPIKNLVIPSLEVLLLGVLIYALYSLLVRTRVVLLLRGLLYLGLLYIAAFFLQLETLLWLINLLAPSFMIALAIVFQPEIRKIFLRLGQGDFLSFSRDKSRLDITPVIKSVFYLSKYRRGALIALSQQGSHRSIAETGTILEAQVSEALLLSVFMYDTKLHDGAVVIEGGRILCAGSILPLSERQDPIGMGTRHRAAIGLSEESDAVVLAVSEETGYVSVAFQGELRRYPTEISLAEHLREILQPGQYIIEMLEEE